MRTVLKSLSSFYKKHETALLFSFVFLIAVFFRIYKLPSIPFGLNNDAAWEGSAALNIIHGNISAYLPYAMEGWRGEGIIRLFVAGLMLVTGNSAIDIKLASVVFGIGLIIPLFLLIKNLFSIKPAALTAFFVAISGWHITMSKTGWRAITVPFFATLLFYFYFKGIESKKMIHFILAGIMLSLVSFYTYDAGRMILPFFIVWIIFSSLKIKNYLKQNIKNLSGLLFSFLMVSLPMFYYALNNWQNFTSRSEFLFIGHQVQQAENLIPLFRNIATAALIFNVSANGNDFFIFRPLVDIPVSWVVPIGFAVCAVLALKKKENINYLFILLWFLAGMLPGILSAPNGNRALGIVPCVYFFAALGLMVLLDLTKYIPKLARFIKISAMLLFLGGSLLITFNLYLGPGRIELAGFYPETLITTDYIKTIWTKYDLYLTDNYPRELLTYYLYKDGVNKDAFARNYTWRENPNYFLTASPIMQKQITQNYNQNALGTATEGSLKGAAFFMFDNFENQTIAQALMNKYPHAKKFELFYNNDNIHRPASLVILVPSSDYVNK